MKTLALFFLTALLPSIPTQAQSAADVSSSSAAPSVEPNQADQFNTLPTLTPAEIDAMIHIQTTTVSRLLGVQLTVDGVLPRMKRADHRLQLINPFAPARYGSGEDVTSINPRTGRAEGIVFLGIKF